MTQASCIMFAELTNFMTKDKPIKNLTPSKYFQARCCCFLYISTPSETSRFVDQCNLLQLFLCVKWEYVLNGVCVDGKTTKALKMLTQEKQTVKRK